MKSHPASATDSRRNALKKLLLPALPGWAALGAGASGLTTPVHAQSANQPGKPHNAADRLISLGGGITEVVYALGAQHMLVGTDTTSLYPEAAQKTPKVGYLRQLSAEGLLALRPSALVTSSEAGPPVVLDQLRAAGVRLEVVQAEHSWREVQRKVQAVGRATRLEAQAQQLWAKLDAQWQQVQARVQRKSTPSGPKVLFILSHTSSPLVSGEGTAADAVINLMGARNAMSGFKGYRPMTAEALAAAAPDTILMSTQGLDALGGANQFWDRPELQLTPAWRQRQSERALVHMDALELLGFTPRLPGVIERLHKQVVQA